MEKVDKSSSVLRRLADKNWGNTTEVLSNTYCTHIKQILQYGGEVILTTWDRNLHKLEVAQNKALRIVIGADKITPVTAMQLYTWNKPVTLELK